MSWIAAAVVGGSVVSGFLGSEASSNAADATTQSASMAAAVQREAMANTRADLQPFRAAGGTALERLMTLTGLYEGEGKGSLTTPFPSFGGLSLQQFQKDPGFQFRQAEGEKAIQRGAIARGMDKSTGTLRNLARFNQGIASDEYQTAFGRELAKYTTNFGTDTANKERQFNMLQALSTTGLNASAMTGQAAGNAASGASQALITGGLATSQGILGGASAMNNSIQGGLSNYMYQQRFDQMMSRMPVFSQPSALPSGFGGSAADPWYG